jgi:hypothetical protein
MLWLGLILLIIGCLVAVALHRTLGIMLGVIGLALVLVALVLTADAQAATTLIH